MMKVDSKTGQVVRAFMYISTGSSILDESTLSVRQWKFKPGTVAMVKVPISYSMMGGSHVNYERNAKSMDDVLARYLGKGTVLKGPIPEYPTGRRWGFKEGRGVYELHAGKSGSVESVKVMKSSGDPVFDGAAQQTLGKWRLNRGPLTLELPLCFMLTPDSCKVIRGEMKCVPPFLTYENTSIAIHARLRQRSATWFIYAGWLILLTRALPLTRPLGLSIYVAG